jgi:dTDP-4-dehydrorhamnose reductase
MRILILGHTGMLGNAVYLYLKQFYNVDIINFRWPSQNFIDYIKNYSGDYIINCIGSIPQKNSNYDVNSFLPIFLDKYSNCNIIHPATDCENDDTLYGLSKRIASDWLLSYGKKTTIFKTSIIGIEHNSMYSFLCWAINQKEVDGYIDAKWNGITSLEWAKQCYNYIENKNIDKFITFSTDCISKFDLLNIINEVYKLNLIINPKKNIGKNKCLIGIKLKNIKQQLIELKEFYEK